MTLNPGVLGRENLFDLNQRTLRFTPGPGGYRIQNLPLHWDADFGAKATGAAVKLTNFAFPFSGKLWRTLSVGMNGSIAFRGAEPEPPPLFRRFARFFGGVRLARFAQLRVAGSVLIASPTPAICVFLKPRMHGDFYVKQLAQSLVITWDLTEPYGGIQDFSWTPTVNRFQAVLYKSGTIEMSYQQMHARDGIVGVYPQLRGGAPEPLATLPDLKLTAVDHTFVRATFTDAGAGPYAVEFRTPTSATGASDAGRAAWTIRPAANGRRATGLGVDPAVTVDDHTVSIQGVLPPAFQNGARVTVTAQTPQGRLAPQTITLHGLRDAQVDLSAVKPSGGPFPLAYESFHYYDLPDNRDLACTVIQALGDNFDFLAYYSSFRVDNQEAGTPSEGPRGAGRYAATGTGTGNDPGGTPSAASYCSAGRFQWGFIQPVDVDAIQMQKYPPPGEHNNIPQDIGDYMAQLRERTQNGKIPPYDYAVSQIGHEMDHRWNAFSHAKVAGKLIPLGDPYHWVRGLQAPAAFPYQRPTEASIMGGGVWQDNHNGTYTQLDDNYYVPATGYSYLDLYNMGLIAPSEVPNFFLLSHLVPDGHDAFGHPIFKADRTDITIQDVIAADGPREPNVEHAQKLFNTGMVVIVMHGAKPSALLRQRTDGIRLRWMDYFSTVTGHRAVMTTNPR